MHTDFLAANLQCHRSESAHIPASNQILPLDLLLSGSNNTATGPIAKTVTKPGSFFGIESTAQKEASLLKFMGHS